MDEMERKPKIGEWVIFHDTRKPQQHDALVQDVLHQVRSDEKAPTYINLIIVEDKGGYGRAETQTVIPHALITTDPLPFYWRFATENPRSDD